MPLEVSIGPPTSEPPLLFLFTSSLLLLLLEGHPPRKEYMSRLLPPMQSCRSIKFKERVVVVATEAAVEARFVLEISCCKLNLFSH